MHHGLTPLAFILLTTGCFRIAQPPPSPVDSAPRETRAQLEERARRVLGVAPEEEMLVNGPAAGTAFKLKAHAGECLDIAVATDPAIATGIEVTPGPTLIFPTATRDGSDASDLSGEAGRNARLRYCADRDGEIEVVLDSSLPLRLDRNHILAVTTADRPYAIAVARLPEEAAARSERLTTQRVVFLEAEREKCDELARQSAAFDCMEKLQLTMERRDAESSAMTNAEVSSDQSKSSLVDGASL